MKTTIIYLFLIAISTTSSTAAQRSPDPVRDTDGKEVRSAFYYHILPAAFHRERGGGTGGGVTLRSIRKNKTCPFDVIQQNDKLDNGSPLTFIPVVNPKKGVVRLSTDLTIKFCDVYTICNQSDPAWRVDFYDGANVISTSYGKAAPSAFKIEKYERDYKLVYCPTVCKTCKAICSDIAISFEGGIRRLVLGKVPFKVKFMKY